MQCSLNIKFVINMLMCIISGARDPAFLHALVAYYMKTNSSSALDILSGIREPLDKVYLLEEGLPSGLALCSFEQDVVGLSPESNTNILAFSIFSL